MRRYDTTIGIVIISTSGCGETCVNAKMDKNVSKKSKVKVDKSTKSAIYQLVYDFIKRDSSACEVAELLKKKKKLVVNFSSL